MTINDELKDLYEKHWSKLIEEAQSREIKSSCPLLIKVDSEYENADIKIMIVGQETDGWFKLGSEKTKLFEVIRKRYYEYFYQPRDGKGRFLNRKPYWNKRPFWNQKNFLFFETQLTKYFEGETKDRKVAFLWNNISKIGKVGRGKPGKEITKLERECFNVIAEEFEILKPDVVIFTTGKRDLHIKHHFGSKSEFIPIDTANLIAEVKLEEFPEICAIRVPHPNRRVLGNSPTLRDIKQGALSFIKQCWEAKHPHEKTI